MFRIKIPTKLRKIHNSSRIHQTPNYSFEHMQNREDSHRSTSKSWQQWFDRETWQQQRGLFASALNPGCKQRNDAIGLFQKLGEARNEKLMERVGRAPKPFNSRVDGKIAPFSEMDEMMRVDWPVGYISSNYHGSHAHTVRRNANGTRTYRVSHCVTPRPLPHAG